MEGAADHDFPVAAAGGENVQIRPVFPPGYQEVGDVAVGRDGAGRGDVVRGDVVAKDQQGVRGVLTEEAAFSHGCKWRPAQDGRSLVPGVLCTIRGLDAAPLRIPAGDGEVTAEVSGVVGL